MSDLRFPRLINSPEYGEFLLALDPQPVSPAQLSQSAFQIKSQLAAGAAGAAVVTTSAALKLGLSLLVGASLLGTYLVVSGPKDPAPAQAQDQVSPHNPAAVFEPDEPSLAIPNENDNHSAIDSAKENAKGQGDLKKSLITHRASNSPEKRSVLPKQINLYDKAISAGQRRDYKAAIALLNQLLNDYPGTLLKAEAQLSRVEYLTRSRNYTKAIPELRRLLAKPEHKGRFGELFRLLGDLELQKGNCEGARNAYNSASAYKLTARDQKAVQKGMALCPSP